MYDITTNQKITRVQLGVEKKSGENLAIDYTRNLLSFVFLPIHMPCVIVFVLCTVNYKYHIFSSKSQHF